MDIMYIMDLGISPQKLALIRFYFIKTRQKQLQKFSKISPTPRPPKKHKKFKPTKQLQTIFSPKGSSISKIYFFKKQVVFIKMEKPNSTQCNKPNKIIVDH